jgi:hypothetical protein
MVSARDLVDEAEGRGARFRVVGDRLEATPASAFDAKIDQAIGEHKAEIVALLRERGGDRATDDALFVQALLRQGRFAPEPAPCAYHCGYTHERCRRCGAPFAEHYPPFGNESR